MTLLDEVCPDYDVRERHELWVPAEPHEAYAALKAVTAGEIRLLGPLLRVRNPGRRRRAGDPRAPALDDLYRIGFVQLGERPDEEILAGAIGRFWSPTGNRPRRVSAQDFAAFSEPGYVKGVLNFTVRAEGGGSRITTETRVVGTDREATRKFRRYWLVIRPGSGAIRRSWLKAIRRRLARTPPGSGPGSPRLEQET